jgi:thiol-disulfide isomerase/thioredoxin
MRSPTLLGALAALAIGTIAMVVLLAAVLDRPASVPTPGAPTAPPLSTGSPRQTALPTAIGSAGPGATGSPQLFTQPPEGVGIGQRAPRIELPQLGGGTIDTGALEGPLWINFMATWCPSCRDELPMMESMQGQLGEELTIVLVDVNEDRQLVRDFIESLNVSLPTALDEEGLAQQAWGAYALPKHFWLDADGVVQAVLFGGAPRDVFIESIRSVVPDAAVE